MEAAVLFYVSGHGFGHSVRTIEVIENLSAIIPGTKIHVRSSAPRWLYERGLTSPFEYYNISADPCIVQDDAFSVDIERSYSEVVSFYENQNSFIDLECQFVAEKNISLIVSDIAPVAFEIARKSSIPAVAVANFTWDWIYSYCFRGITGANSLIESIRNSYKKADAIFSTPLSAGLDIYDNVIDIPFITKASKKEREELRENIGVPKTACLVLLSFGGFGPGYIDISGFSEMKDYFFVSLTPYDNYPSNVKSVPRGLYEHQDLVSVADVVVGKPGYGIVSECTSSATPFVYTDRNDFPEYDVIVDFLKHNLPSCYVPLKDVRSGKLLPYLEKARFLPPKEYNESFDGGRKAAVFISEMLINKLAHQSN